MSAGGVIAGFVSKSGLFHPVIDNIPVILPRHLRNGAVELEAVQAAAAHNPDDIPAWNSIIGQTLGAISEARPGSEWEWEDEEFWSGEYTSLGAAAQRKNWNDRLWRNEKFVLEVDSRTDGFRNQVILDIGAGDAHYFRQLVASPRIETATYIATDISLAALKLNRQQNPHQNSAYVLCSADNLPFRPRSINVAFLFGILHHSRRQAGSLDDICELVADSGLLLLHEGLSRPTVSDVVPLLSKRSEESAHEHRLDRDEFRKALDSDEFVVIGYEEYGTVFYGGIMRVLGRLLTRWRLAFELVSMIDRAVAATAGRTTGFLAGGEVLALLQVERTQ